MSGARTDRPLDSRVAAVAPSPTLAARERATALMAAVRG